MRLTTLLLLFLGLSFSADAQKRKAKTPKPGTVERPVNTFRRPAWAPAGYNLDKHIYFPDYYTFYDPQRGYVTWEKDSWVASPSMPLFLKEEDLRKARIRILEDISIYKHPELNYPRYMKLYPAEPGKPALLVPVPAAAGQPGKQ